MKRAGRPTKLTDAIAKKIAAGVAKGLPRRHAAASAGVSATALFSWIARGRELIESGATELSEDDRLFADFADRLEKADSAFVDELVGKVQAAANSPRTWQAAAWLLERRHHKEFGRRQAVEMSGPDGESLKLDARIENARKQLTPEEKEQEEKELTARFENTILKYFADLSVEEFGDLMRELASKCGWTWMESRGFSAEWVRTEQAEEDRKRWIEKSAFREQADANYLKQLLREEQENNKLLEQEAARRK